MAALAVGGYWYLRNLVDHGSPFWPFLSGPWGDPVPAYLERFDTSLLDRPRATLDGRAGDYLDFLGAAPLMLILALAAPLAVRRRAVLAGAGAALLGWIIWARSPYTGNAGVNDTLDLSLSTTRYLLPVFAAAALTLALASRGPGRAARAVVPLLAALTAWSLIAALAQGFPRAPSWLVLALGAAAGGLLGALPGAGLAFRRLPAAGLAAACALVLALAAPGFPERYAQSSNIGSRLVGWAEDRRGFESGSEPVAFAPAPVGVLAGARLRHELEVIPAGEPCGGVARRAREGLVVIRRDPNQRFFHRFTAAGCLRGRRPLYDDGHEFRVYGPPAPGRR